MHDGANVPCLCRTVADGRRPLKPPMRNLSSDSLKRVLLSCTLALRRPATLRQRTTVPAAAAGQQAAVSVEDVTSLNRAFASTDAEEQRGTVRFGFPKGSLQKATQDLFKRAGRFC